MHSMLCGNTNGVAGLLCIVMLGTIGLPMVTPLKDGVSCGGKTPTPTPKTPTPTPNMDKISAFNLKHHVRQSQSLSAGEQQFIQKRKQMALMALKKLGIECTPDEVPHIAILGSGGGQRAAVGLMGALHQMAEDGLLDTALYLAGVSGSAWSMSSLYKDPQWSANMDRAVSRLSGPGVSLQEALTWLGNRSKEEHFSLTDIWGVVTSTVVMKQLDRRRLSEDTGCFNPYPIYSAVNKNCRHGPEKGKWFEMTPHEVGFTELGLFIDTTRLGSRFPEAGPEGPEMDMVRLQGIGSSIIADGHSLYPFLPDWLNRLLGAAALDKKNLLDVVSLWKDAPKQIKSSWDLLDYYGRVYKSILIITEIIKKNTDNPAMLSALNYLQETMKERMSLHPFTLVGQKNPERRKLIVMQWSQKVLAPLQTWSQSLKEGQVKEIVSLLVEEIFPLIAKWEWGTTENFLYKYPGREVPSCIRRKEHLQLIDPGATINIPYPPFLGQRRDVDLLITLDYGLGDPTACLTPAKEYAATVKKPFPDIDHAILREKDWPRDLYVMEGKNREPTIVFMPLFNRHNCKDAEEVKARMEEFTTFQLPYSQQKIDFLLETAKANIKRNKATLVREIYKAAVGRHNKL